LTVSVPNHFRALLLSDVDARWLRLLEALVGDVEGLVGIAVIVKRLSGIS
jgi:hypothetical protein